MFGSFLRWLHEHVRGFHTALGAYLALGLVAMLLCVGVFVLLATGVARGALARFDVAILLWMNSFARPVVDGVALEVTSLGSIWVVWLTVLIASGFLWETRHRYSAALLWVAVIGGMVLNRTLKFLFDRPRPDLFEWRTPYAGHSSFPSGHTMTATVVYATMAYLVVRLEPSRRLRRLTLAAFAVVILLVAASRVYLGVHYPSDVLAGIAIGLAWATLCALGIEVLRSYRERQPELARAEDDLEEEAIP
jgi:undecaprenyl-diphosphatase